MAFLRKILVGLISLTFIVGVYVLYTRSRKTHPIKMGRGVDVGEANIPTSDGQGGKIGPAMVETIREVTYITRNQRTKEIEREFGFAELLRTVGEVWEVDKPWMKIYQRKFQFHITADKGTTELQTMVGTSTPKDATFQGNVTIRIVPLGDSTYEESTIYLDNLIFLSDKSQFSTPGPVKLVSQDINMDGKGMEFVYNERFQRIDYLRLTHLDELRIRGPAQAMFSKFDAEPSPQITPKTPENDSKTDTPAAAPKASPDEPEKIPPAETTPPSPDLPATAPPEYYKCILSENVVVETSDEIIFARDAIAINDILWSNTLMAEDANSLADANSFTDANSLPGAEKGDSVQIAGDGPKPKPTTGPNLPPEPNSTPEEIIEIVVTCDNGILFVPTKSKRTLAKFPRAQADKPSDPAYLPEAFDDPNGRSTFLAQRIDYNSVNGDAIAAGPAELVFYTGSMMTLDPNETSVPVTVTSTESVRLVKESNQAFFTGDPLLTMPQANLISPRDVTFTASQFTVNLPETKSGRVDVPGEVVAAGPVELIFYVEDSNAADTNEPPVPVSITALKEARFVPDSNQVIFDVNCVCTMPKPGLPPEQNFTLTSPRLIANLPENVAKDAPSAPDVNALGPVELKFYVSSFDSNEPNAAPLPATVIAKHARFVPADNQVRFEGDCQSVVTREDPNFIEQYILSSQKMVVDLPAEANEPAAKSAMGIEHFTASGGVVTLATKKMAGELQLSGIELICRKFDYDPNSEEFIAEGPGKIWLNNAEEPDPNELTGKFSLKEPCWVRIQNYDKLTYLEGENRIIADAASEGAIVVEYLTMVDGKPGELSIVTANHVEADLIETALGETELASLTASGGITYQGKDNEFIGGELFYDHANQSMKVIGSESVPCQLNGALTDEIEYDLKTDTVKAKLVGPGALRLK